MVNAYAEPFESIVDGSICIANDFVDTSLVASFPCAVKPRRLCDKLRHDEVRGFAVWQARRPTCEVSEMRSTEYSAGQLARLYIHHCAAIDGVRKKTSGNTLQL